MITDKGLVRYCNCLYASHAQYVWGADGEVITQELIESLKKNHGASHYANVNLDVDEGKIGCDCSGMLTKVSGMNITAASHYQKCVEKGKISKIPKDKVCLIFREENGKIVHVGVYMGNGKLTEMWNGCEQKSFIPSKWTYYGIPVWVKYTQSKPKETITVGKAISGYSNAQNALDKKNPKVTIQAGEYFVFREYKGATNITKTKGVAGSWVVL